MPKQAEYCKCLNTYTRTKCKKRKCKQHPIWKQGIGFIGGKGTTEE